MGIFDDYGIDPESIKESSFDFADGTYRFEISEAEERNGSTNNPYNDYFVIVFQLEDENGDAAGEKQNWTTLRRSDEDGNDIGLLKGHEVGLSILKGMLKQLGIKGSQLSNFTGEEIVGKTGTLTLKTTNRNGKSNQNLRIVDVDEVEEKPKKAAPKAKAKAVVKKAPAKTVTPPVEEDDGDDDNPFG